MKLLVSSLVTVLAVLTTLALPACSGTSGGLGGNDGGSSGSGSGGSSSTGSGGSSSGSGSSSGGDGTTTCTPGTACGTGGRTFDQCTTVDSTTKACKAMKYKTSDGKSFSCNSCEDCTGATKQLTNYCAGIPDGDGGSGNTTCTAAQACGSTGSTFQQCTTVSSTGGCVGIAYQLSTGSQFTCASCGDCSAAVTALDTYCAGGGTPTTTCTSWSTCGTSSLQYESCTTSLNGVCQSMYYETSDANSFQCTSCGDCTSASTNMESYCASMAQSTTCGSASACGSTGITYSACTTTQAGSCITEYYSTTDGNTYTCNTCSDCTAAVTALDAHCASLSGITCGTTTCTAGNLCCTCTGTQECLSSNGGTYTCATYGCQ